METHTSALIGLLCGVMLRVHKQKLNMVEVVYCVTKTNETTAKPVLGKLAQKNGINTLPFFKRWETDILLCRHEAFFFRPPNAAAVCDIVGYDKW